MNAVDGVARNAMILPDQCLLLGIADKALADRLVRAVKRVARKGRVVVASTLSHLHQLSARIAPDAILLECEMLGNSPLEDFLRQLTVTAPVILIAPLERQAEVARFVAGGGVEFVARAGDFIPMAASLVERRLRWARMSESVLGPPWAAMPADIGAVFRHEINNPLTGILGNAELVLSHRDCLSATDAQRLQTVVDLAVRLRETIRRLSNAWENQRPSAKSA